LNGQGIILDFIFDDLKGLELTFLDTNPNTTYFYSTQVFFNVDTAAFPGFPTLTADFLSDTNGSPIASGSTLIGFQDSGVFGFSVGFDEDEVDGLIHHDIHYELIFPNNPTMQVTNATLKLSITDPSGFITVVPEPSILLLLGTGVVAARRRYSRRILACSNAPAQPDITVETSH
jgi:hypothetical protein